MSKPKGKRIQRELATVIKEELDGYGCEFELDFSKRGGHQQMLVTLPNHEVISIEISSSPRNEGAELGKMRQKCKRIIRDNRLLPLSVLPQTPSVQSPEQ